MNFELRKTRDFGELVTDTFTFVKLYWKPLVKCFIYICGFFVLASIITDIVFRMKFADVLSPTKTGFGRPGVLTTEYFLLLFLSYFRFFVISLTVLCFMSLYHDKGNVAPTVEEVWVYFKFYFFRYILSFFILLILQIVGFVFCLLPGFYLMPIINIILAGIILENGTLSYSFSRGFSLITNNWWITFGALFVMGIIVYMAMGFAAIPTLILTLMQGFTTSLKPLTVVLTVLFTVIQHVCSIVLILPWVLSALSYYSLAEAKEAVGLYSRIETLGKTTAPKELPGEEY